MIKQNVTIASTLQAANSLIYPMDWQHIFIPIRSKVRELHSELCGDFRQINAATSARSTSINSNDVA